jgi:hypothetical protein
MRTAIYAILNSKFPQLECATADSKIVIRLRKGRGEWIPTSNSSVQHGAKQLSVGLAKRSERGRFFNGQKSERYLQFHLYKENRDTVEAINVLARLLRLDVVSAEQDDRCVGLNSVDSTE